MERKKMRYDVKDLGLAEKGRLRIEWANKSMQVLNLIRDEFQKEKPLKGLAGKAFSFSFGTSSFFDNWGGL